MTEQDLNMFEQRASTEEASSSGDVKALVAEVRRLHKVVGVNPPVGKWEPKGDHVVHEPHYQRDEPVTHVSPAQSAKVAADIKAQYDEEQKKQKKAHK